MIRALTTVILLFLAAAGVVWLAERPGDIVLTWQGYEIRTSLMVAAVLVAVAIAAIALVGAVIRRIVNTPQSVGRFFGARRRDRGYRALSRGMIAVGAGDVRSARRAAHEAQTLLGKEPLVLLLTAQAAQIAGDGAAARTAFEALSAERDTRLLGLHGLFIEARRQGEHAAARHFAEEAVRLQPKVGWAGTALFEYQARATEWRAALARLQANGAAGLVEPAKARRLKAVLETALAMELEAGEPEEARKLAHDAHKSAPALVPAATLLARLQVRAGDIRRAARTLEATWKLEPHPELAEAYASVRPGDSVLDRLKRVKRLSDFRVGHPESAMAVARAAIDARAWSEARAALEGELKARPSERVCLLMAEIEEGENGDQGRVREWLTRAIGAPRDPSWVADGRIFPAWAPLSPITGVLDAFEWRVAAEPPVPRLPIDIGNASPSQPVERAVVTPPSASAKSAALPPAAVNRPASSPPAIEPLAPAVPVVQAGGAPKGVRPMARAPDDPGPMSPDEEEGADDLIVFRPGRMA